MPQKKPHIIASATAAVLCAAAIIGIPHLASANVRVVDVTPITKISVDVTAFNEAGLGVKRKITPNETAEIDGMYAPQLLAAGPVDGIFDIPAENTGMKTYMDYRAITAKNSKQYKLQESAWTDENGFRRYNDYYMVALGTYYTGYECGKVFRITLDTGVSFEAITGDVKSDAHTDVNHQHRGGNIVEFIVDTKAISKSCKTMGDMSYADGVNFHGKIAAIELISATTPEPIL